MITSFANKMIESAAAGSERSCRSVWTPFLWAESKMKWKVSIVLVASRGDHRETEEHSRLKSIENFPSMTKYETRNCSDENWAFTKWIFPLSCWQNKKERQRNSLDSFWSAGFLWDCNVAFVYFVGYLFRNVPKSHGSQVESFRWSNDFWTSRALQMSRLKISPLRHSTIFGQFSFSINISKFDIILFIPARIIACSQISHVASRHGVVELWRCDSVSITEVTL